MSLGQTMLTAAFLVLVTILVLNANTLVINSEQETYEGEAFDLATNYAQALLNEIGRKKYDQYAIDTLYQAPSAFTPAGSLGPESGEVITPWPDVAPFKSFTTYNDVDDYNGYVRTIDSEIIKGFQVSAVVYYVTQANTNTKSTTQTYLKRIDVSVQHPSYLKTVTFSTIATY